MAITSSVQVRLSSGLQKKLEEVIKIGLSSFVDRVVMIAKVKVPYDTGNLRRSIEATKIPGGYQISTATGYGAYVELGTKRMAARPYLGPAVAEALKSAQSKGSWK